MEEQLEHKACMICGQQQLDGIRIGSGFICVSCEEEIVHTDVRDAKYPFFIHQMKQIWHKIG